MATGPDLTDPALQQLARMLVSKQQAIARPGVTVGAKPPGLPAFQQPGSSMPAMPSAAVLWDQYNRQQPQAPSAAAPPPQQPPPVAAPPPAMPQDVPPMPSPAAVGPQTAPTSVLQDMWAALKKGGQERIPPWAMNFGNLTQQGGGGGTPVG